MITNLFSGFDPSISIFNMSWLLFFIFLLIFPIIHWMLSNSTTLIYKKIITTFKKEVRFTFKTKEKGLELIIITLFMLIIIINIIALYPQVFSITSHVTFNLPLSLVFWTSLIIFGWTKNTNMMLSHLVPQGTPNALIIFIVLIELVRNIIRPITLSVRLTANLIAGHLLISLLGGALIRITTLVRTCFIFIPILLTILELAVACIQAYVFITLITLYTTEVK